MGWGFFWWCVGVLSAAPLALVLLWAWGRITPWIAWMLDIAGDR